MTLAFPVPRAKPPQPFRKALSLPPGNSFIRFLTAHAKASISHEPPAEIAAKLWPQDRAVDLLLRAASTPASTLQATWAEELAQRVVADFLEALYPVSAAAALFQQGLSLTLDRAALLSVPGFAVGIGTNTASFVADGQPIPVYQGLATAAVLEPHKVAGIFVLTREMIESSNAERYIEDLATKSIGRVIDEVLVDANPASAQRPAGLRNGVAASTPSGPSSSTGEAFFNDLATLADAVGPVAGNAPIAFIGSPGRALKARLLIAKEIENIIILGSNAVINDFLCVATAALVSAVGDQPDVETANAANLHMDSVPQAVGSAGPGRSLWQTDAIGMKVRWPVTWALRDPRGFAWMTPTNW